MFQVNNFREAFYVINNANALILFLFLFFHYKYRVYRIEMRCTVLKEWYAMVSYL